MLHKCYMFYTVDPKMFVCSSTPEESLLRATHYTLAAARPPLQGGKVLVLTESRKRYQTGFLTQKLFQMQIQKAIFYVVCVVPKVACYVETKN